jgi:cytohesin
VAHSPHPNPGGAHKTWKRRWFRLCNGCLYYFENEEATQPKGTIPLENLIVREASDYKRPSCFEIIAEGGEDQAVKAAKTKGGKVVQGKHSSYRIQAADRLEMEEWIRSITAAMSKDPIYELYRNKRDNMGS